MAGSIFEKVAHGQPGNSRWLVISARSGFVEDTGVRGEVLLQTGTDKVAKLKDALIGDGVVDDIAALSSSEHPGVLQCLQMFAHVGLRSIDRFSDRGDAQLTRLEKMQNTQSHWIREDFETRRDHRKSLSAHYWRILLHVYPFIHAKNILDNIPI